MTLSMPYSDGMPAKTSRLSYVSFPFDSSSPIINRTESINRQLLKADVLHFSSSNADIEKAKKVTLDTFETYRSALTDEQPFTGHILSASSNALSAIRPEVYIHSVQWADDVMENEKQAVISLEPRMHSTRHSGTDFLFSFGELDGKGQGKYVAFSPRNGFMLISARKVEATTRWANDYLTDISYVSYLSPGFVVNGDRHQYFSDNACDEQAQVLGKLLREKVLARFEQPA